MDFLQRLDQAADYLLLWLQIRAPKKTGNLAILGIRKAYDPLTNYPIIVIGGEVAPYAIYTNEPWISPMWMGRTNPNQEWIQSAVIEVLPTLRFILSGTITRDDYMKMAEQNKITLASQFEGMAIQYA